MYENSPWRPVISLGEDITGKQVKVKVAENPRGTTLLDLNSSTSGVVITDPATGTFYPDASSSTVAGLNFYHGWCSIFLYDGVDDELVAHGDVIYHEEAG